MKNKKIITVGVSALVLLSSTTLVFAQGSKASMKANMSQSSLVEKANTAIDKRVTDLTDLETRISAMKNVSSSQISSLTASLETQKNDLLTLKTKIASDSDMKSLTADVKSVTVSNRTYALVIPKARILVAADSATTITDMLTALGTKLQTRISQAQGAGKDVTSLTAALVDFNAKLADATSLSGSIPTAISGLVPDQGDKTVMASNETALKTARKNLVLIQNDLKSARADMKTILAGVKGVGADAGTDTQTPASQPTTTSATGTMNQ